MIQDYQLKQTELKNTECHSDTKNDVLGESNIEECIQGICDKQINSAPICSRIVLVLDQSGSMNSQKNDIIGGVNETIIQQRLSSPEENDMVFFNIIKFNGIVSEPTNYTLADVPFLTNNDYVPTGGTALYDAIGISIRKYQEEQNIIFIVATDGEENASKSYDLTQITTMLKQQREEKGWNIIYLSEDLSTFKQGVNIGITSNAYNCNNLMTGKNKLGSVLSDNMCQTAISQIRKGEKNIKIAQASQTTPDINKTNSLNSDTIKNKTASYIDPGFLVNCLSNKLFE